MGEALRGVSPSDLFDMENPSEDSAIELRSSLGSSSVIDTLESSTVVSSSSSYSDISPSLEEGSSGRRNWAATVVERVLSKPRTSLVDPSLGLFMQLIQRASDIVVLPWWWLLLYKGVSRCVGQQNGGPALLTGANNIVVLGA